MSAPRNRAQRILQFITGSMASVSLSEIAAAVAKDEPQVENYKQYALHVSAQLSQMHAAGKVARTGTSGSYRYCAASIEKPAATEAKPSVKRAARAPAARKPKAAAPPKRPPAPKPTQASRQAFANLRQPAPRLPGERESVAEFEARGGRIQKLAHGESSQPAYADVRAVDRRSMRTRLQQALVTDPANTTDDEAVVA